jgi:hypothetical protein
MRRATASCHEHDGGEGQAALPFSGPLGEIRAGRWRFQWQIVRHAYCPVYGFCTCSGPHELVPMGGTIGIGIGLIDGGTIPQIVGGQIGRKSIAYSQIGCMFPLTH